MAGAYTTVFVSDGEKEIHRQWMYAFPTVGMTIVIRGYQYGVMHVTIDLDDDSNGVVTVRVRPIAG